MFAQAVRHSRGPPSSILNRGADAPTPTSKGSHTEPMKRHVLAVAAIWIALTALGVLLTGVELFPPARSDKGLEIDRAWSFLLLMAVPVYTFVVSVIGYSIWRFRRSGPPTGEGGTDDGPPIAGRGAFPLAWFGITSALAVLVMIYPGLVQIPTIFRTEPNPDVVVRVEAFQWAWRLTYPNAGVESTDEMVLPVGRSVRFDITSLDVVHAFWVPAFVMRIDAVPGLTTSISLRPTATGSYVDDPAFRLQCSQLCGLEHSRMMMPVRVVSEADFQAWLATRPAIGGGPAPTPAAGATELSISAKAIRFSSDRLEARADVSTTITFQNDDAGVIHNIAIYNADGTLVDNARSPFEAGPKTQTLVVPALPAGSYVFKCDAHPTQMVGTFEVR